MSVDRFKLFTAFNQQNFNINPAYIQITGDIISGYFLSQLCFLARAYDWQEFYISDPRLQEKYHLSRKQLLSRREHLIKLGVISVSKKGYPAKNYYIINIDIILNLVEALDLSITASSSQKGTTDASVVPKGDDLLSQKGTTSGTEKGLHTLYNDIQMNNNNEAVVDKIFEKGLSMGVTENVIRDLLLQYSQETILKHLELMQTKPNINYPSGWLIKSLKKGFDLESKQKTSYTAAPDAWDEKEYKTNIEALNKLLDPNDWREIELQKYMKRPEQC